MNYKKFKMAESLKPVEGERFALRHFELTRKEIQFDELREAINRRRTYGQEPGIFVRLEAKKDGGGHSGIIMTDTEMEWHTNWRFLFNANGRVLVAGLGLGMIVLAVQDREEIEKILILEKEKEIIALVKPQLPFLPKVEIILADALEWRPPKGEKFDTIYFDIWPDICGDNYEEMKRLHRRFSRNLNRANPKAFMDSWRREETRRRARAWR